MGASSSHETVGQVLSTGGEPKQPSYNGCPVLYHYTNIDARMDITSKSSFPAPNVSMTITNIESYYPNLAQMYTEGWRMLMFAGKPGSIRNYGPAKVVHAEVSMQFQGVFIKVPEEEANLGYELRVEKSVLIHEMFRTTGIIPHNSSASSSSQTHNIVQTIERVTQNGGRLVCIEMTGMSEHGMMMNQIINAGFDSQLDKRRMMAMKCGHSPTINIGVDVFYEIPTHPSPQQYTYNIMNLPVISKRTRSGFTSKWVSNCNWQGIMSQMLGAGWRLVEVFMDMSTDFNFVGLTSAQMQQNSLWVFEKPLSRMNDPTPLYEATMVEFWYETTFQRHGMGFGGATATTTANWESKIDSMGQQGWEVVRIMTTPEFELKGSFSSIMHTKCMIFFERKIMSSNFATPPIEIAEDTKIEDATRPSHTDLYKEQPDTN